MSKDTSKSQHLNVPVPNVSETSPDLMFQMSPVPTASPVVTRRSVITPLPELRLGDAALSTPSLASSHAMASSSRSLFHTAESMQQGQPTAAQAAGAIPNPPPQATISSAFNPVAQHIAAAAATATAQIANRPQFTFQPMPSIPVPPRRSLLTEALQRRGIGGAPTLPAHNSPDSPSTAGYRSTPSLTASEKQREFDEAFTPLSLQDKPVLGSHTRQLSSEAATKSQPSTSLNR